HGVRKTGFASSSSLSQLWSPRCADAHKMPILPQRDSEQRRNLSPLPEANFFCSIRFIQAVAAPRSRRDTTEATLLDPHRRWLGLNSLLDLGYFPVPAQRLRSEEANAKSDESA